MGERKLMSRRYQMSSPARREAYRKRVLPAITKLASKVALKKPAEDALMCILTPERDALGSHIEMGIVWLHAHSEDFVVLDSATDLRHVLAGGDFCGTDRIKYDGFEPGYILCMECMVKKKKRGGVLNVTAGFQRVGAELKIPETGELEEIDGVPMPKLHPEAYAVTPKMHEKVEDIMIKIDSSMEKALETALCFTQLDTRM